MNEDLFWSMIEDAWKSVGSMTKARQRLAQGKLSEEKAEELVEALEEVIPSLLATLEQLSQKCRNKRMVLTMVFFMPEALSLLRVVPITMR
jgi:AcrR family transcriptional regulator